MPNRPFPSAPGGPSVSERNQTRPTGGRRTGGDMGQAVVHFEVIGKDGTQLQRYYAELFGWEIDTGNALSYGYVARDGNTNAEGVGISGGVASGQRPDDPGHVTFYVEVPDVGAALAKA